jgi:hypothetical protein
MAPTLTSTTSTKEEMEHALSENWRETPVIPDAPKPSEAEAPEDAEPAPKTADESETPETPESEKPKDKPKSKYQRTIDKLTARNHAAETKAEQLQRELDELRSKAAPVDKTAQAAPSGPPKLQDFLNAGKTADEWADARDAWKQQQEIESAKQESAKERLDAYNRGVFEALGKYEDFDEVVKESNLEIPGAAQVAIISLKEQGAAVTYYLAKHPDVCAELMELSDDQPSVIMRIGQIAESLNPAKERSPNEKPKPKPPAPLNPVGASSTRSSIPLEQMSARDYIRVRNDQEARAKGRR